MPASTYEEVLAVIGVSVPAHLEAQAEVPVLSRMQRQGDLIVRPRKAALAKLHIRSRAEVLCSAGLQVVHGEATGNTHWLHPWFGSEGVRWTAASSTDFPVLGVLEVPEGQCAMLIHTDEHGANGIGPGTYEVRQRRQVSTAGEWVRSAD